MTRSTILVSTALGSVVAIGLLIPLSYRKIETWAVGTHQRSVTKSLAEWEAEHAHVASWPEADRAIGMLEYVQWYYVPCPGYRSDPQTEAALEDQRARTVSTIVAALRSFSGEDFGADAARWEAWAKQRPPRKGEK